MAHKGKRLLRHYWVAYAVLALIPILILATTVVVIQTNSRREVGQSLYLRSMQQTATNLDALVSDMQSTVSAMKASAYLGETMAQTEEPLRFENAMTAYIDNAEANSRLPVQMVYYEVGSRDVFTADGRMSYQDFQHSLDKAIDLNRSQFFTRLNETIALRIWLLTPAEGAPKDEMPMAAFAFPVLSDLLKKQGTFVFLVNTEDILSLISSYLGVQPDYLYLYTSNYNGAAAMYEKEAQSEQIRAAAIQSRVGVIDTLQVAGEKYDVLHYKTDLHGFQLITCVHMSKLYTGDAPFSLLYLVGACALVVLVGAFFIARFFYRPVRSLLDAIDDDEDDAGADEFTRIDQHLNRLQERLAMARPMMRDRLLQALLRSRLDEAGVAQLESVCPDIQMAGHYACVGLVSVDRNTPVDQLLLFERMDLGGADVHGVYLEEERLLALLILSVEESDRRLEQLRQIREALVARGIQQPRISAGRRVQGAAKVPESFLEAYIAMNSRMQAVEGERDIFLYDVSQADRTGGGNSWLMVCEDGVNIYLQALRSLNQHTALEMLHTLLQRMNESCASLLNISYARFELYSRALRLCEDNVAQAFSGRGNAMEQITDEKRFQALMEEVTVANCQAVESKRASTYQNTRQKILSAIRARCFDASFSLSELSEQVEYSATYINRCLREETGYSFIQYVSMLRIARAKELLVNTDDKIKDIVAQVGYQDMASFTRKFKEYEGVTPMEYRNINRA